MMRGGGGGGEGRGQGVRFLSNTGTDSLQNHNATKAAFNVGP